MYIRNRTARLIYRVIFCVICGTGIYIHMTGTGDATHLLWYFTVLSNLLCLFFFIYLVIRDLIQKDRYREPMVFKGAVTMCIVLTGLVFNLMLAREFGGGAIPLAGNTFVHILTPIMVFLDYLLFSPKGRFDGTDPLSWTVIPLVYLAAIFLRAALGGGPLSQMGGVPSYYPYPFINGDLIGWAAVARNLVLMAIAYIAASYILVLVDHLLAKAGRRRLPRAS